MADARKDRRTLLSLKIRYKSATLQDFIERYSMDISGGGVFIKAKKPLAVGTLLKFEFVLQDQSTLIHGVGRVVWRREEAEATESNPSGMGIKFIKMDPESRSIVQRIVDERSRPGAFDHGKSGVSVQPEAIAEPSSLGADPTRVSHVSEFLVSAFETGGAGETATREARAAAVGAFRQSDDSVSRSPVDAPGRGAASAFGSSASIGTSTLRSSAAPAMREFPEDELFDNETTTVQALPMSEFPPADAAATVVASESPFAHERKPTPVVPVAVESSSPLEAEVPDLFGPDSFGPAPGEVIDASLLDPAVATVPPKASALPRSAMPESTGAPHEAFRVPQAPAVVRNEPAEAEPSQPKSRAGLLAVLLVLLAVAGGGVAAWQFGYLDGVSTGRPASAPVTKAPPVIETPVAPVAEDEPSPAAETDEPAGTVPEDVDVAEASESKAEAAAPSVQDGNAKIQVTTVPKGALVSINGKGVGRAPLEVEYEVGTQLSFLAKARGFLPRRSRVVVEEETTSVNLVLPALPYEVEVLSDPPGARASAVGGGEVTTPGTLRFRSMPASRRIVVSKDGYSTVSVSVKRSSFVQEKSQMFSAVSVTLAREADSAESPEPSADTAMPSTGAETEPAAVEPTEAQSSEPSADDVAE